MHFYQQKCLVKCLQTEVIEQLCFLLAIVKGDIKDAASLKELLTGQDAVYLNLSVEQSSGVNDFQAEREGLKNILQVAKASNIKRVGYLSSLVQFYKGINWWALDIKKEAVKNIKQSGLNYSIFYPSTWIIRTILYHLFQCIVYQCFRAKFTTMELV